MMNVSYEAVGGLDTMSSAMSSWLITVMVFIVVLLVIFILSKNFRRFLYGAVITGFLLADYHFSRWIGSSALKGDVEPLKWVGYVIGFILISVIIGKFVQKTKFIRKIEGFFREADEKRHPEQ
jgi:hypothetical protein